MSFGRTVAGLFLAGEALALVLPWPAQAAAVLVVAHLAVALLLFSRGPSGMPRRAFPSTAILLTLARLVAALVVLRAAIEWRGAEAASFDRLGEVLGAVACLVFLAVVAVMASVVVGGGAVRVAEVAARFALDGLPGKQLGLDSAASSGAISAGALARGLLAADADANFFGAMDGTTRFLRAETMALLSAAVLAAAVGAALHTDNWAGPVAFVSLASSGLLASAAITAASAVLLVTGVSLGNVPAAPHRMLRAKVAAPCLALGGCALAVLGMVASPHLWLIVAAGVAAAGAAIALSLAPTLPEASRPVRAAWGLAVAPDLAGPALESLAELLQQVREDLDVRLGLDPGLPDSAPRVDASLPRGTVELLARGLPVGRVEFGPWASGTPAPSEEDDLRWSLFSQLVGAAHLLLTADRVAALADEAATEESEGPAQRLSPADLLPELRALLRDGLPLPPVDLLIDALSLGPQEQRSAALRVASVHYLVASARGLLLARQLHPDGRELLERLRDGESVGEALDDMIDALLVASRTRPDRRWPMLVVEPQWAEQLSRLMSGRAAEVLVLSPADLPLFVPMPPVEVLQDGLRQG
jgi:hypothetical protein